MALPGRTAPVCSALVVCAFVIGAATLGAQRPDDRQKQPPGQAQPREKPKEGRPAQASPRQPAQPPQAQSPASRPQQPSPGNRPQQSPGARTPQQSSPQPPPATAGRPAQTAEPRSQQQRPAQSPGRSEGQGQRPAQSPGRSEGAGQRGAYGVWPTRPSEPGHAATTPVGTTVRRDRGGRVSEVRAKNGAVIYHAPGGVRRVEMTRPDNRVVVAEARRHGYVQRPFVYSNRNFIKRTYIRNDRLIVRVFRPVSYRGVVYQVYTPLRFFRPGFYAYVFNPWPAPIAWSWGWSTGGWFGFYGGYFTPYTYYRSPMFWLTDYFIAATLQAAYEERAAAAVRPVPYDQGEVGLSPEVKQLIADEVRRQVERERSEEANSATYYYSPDDAPVWGDGASHVFVTYRPLGVSSNYGYCTIGEGDVLQMNRVPAAYADSANLMVLASRRGECPASSTVTVRLQDLQDMTNRMRETVEAGFADLQGHQGEGGIPPLPAGAVGAVDSPLAAQATPDADAASEIGSVYNDADQADREALGQDPGGTPTVSLGMTIDQVRAIMGPPSQFMDAGAKQIYLYRSVKITFTNGRVSDIQ